MVVVVALAPVVAPVVPDVVPVTDASRVDVEVVVVVVSGVVQEVDTRAASAIAGSISASFFIVLMLGRSTPLLRCRSSAGGGRGARRCRAGHRGLLADRGRAGGRRRRFHHCGARRQNCRSKRKGRQKNDEFFHILLDGSTLTSSLLCSLDVSVLKFSRDQAIGISRPDALEA